MGLSDCKLHFMNIHIAKTQNASYVYKGKTSLKSSEIPPLDKFLVNIFRGRLIKSAH